MGQRVEWAYLNRPDILPRSCRRELSMLIAAMIPLTSRIQFSVEIDEIP